MIKIFLSYRRDDAAAYAGRIFDRLHGTFEVFMDVDTIPLGRDFRDVLGDAVGQCDVLLAVIGKSWAEVRDNDGNRRIASEGDFVRYEISAALERGVPVVPLLLDGATIPAEGILPANIRELAYRHGLDIRHASFHADISKLIAGLETFQPQVFPRNTSPGDTQPPTGADGYKVEGRILIEAPITRGAPDGWFLPGAGRNEWFADQPGGPEMVVVPAGEFVMGSPSNEPGRADIDSYAGEQLDHEQLQRVTIARPFAVSRYVITHSQFTDFIGATGYLPDDGPRRSPLTGESVYASWLHTPFEQDDRHPVVCVTWDDAKAYALWLSEQTGQDYRLLSDAKWEYCARAGTTTRFWCGDTISPNEARYSVALNDWNSALAAVDAFKPNPWGLYQVHGNVWEWCEDVWNLSYRGAPPDGSPFRSSDGEDAKVVRGGGWHDPSEHLRAACRDYRITGSDALGDADLRYTDISFRLARTLV